MTGYFKDLITQSLSRTREATLSILGVNDPGLRAHLADQMHNRMGDEGCFLAPPVFEHTFGWKQGDQTFASLKGELLSNSVVETLASAKKYQFQPDLKPYKHQLESWRTLLAEQPKSAVITTGTGSGKTECFMIPILQDLVREHETSQKALVGVRALFLYPLNALINSQRERLDAWTEPYGENIRFCLYNGNTKESESTVRKTQKERPNEILSRERLRKEPAPILMTNATMLEYMLVRQIDDPIIRISQELGALRWIVLDEAHTYVGSQAAELSLLLRRVVEAFGKQASELRFVATSATIAGESAAQKLQAYLADLAGVPNEQVVVIGGSRQVPDLKQSLDIKGSLAEIRQVDQGEVISADRFQLLCNHPVSYEIRHALISSEKPLDLNDLVFKVGHLLTATGKAEQQQELLEWIDLMTDTQPIENEPPFLKLRGHLHQRMLHGLWCCADPNCTAKSTHLKNWFFGQVYVTQRTRCECHAPVYELAFCDDCKTPHLIAEDANGFLRHTNPFAGDEFSLLDDPNEDTPESEQVLYKKQQSVVLSAHQVESYPSISLNRETAELGCLSGENTLRLNIATDIDSSCSGCGDKGKRPAGFLRKCYLGAPFYVANAVPTALEFCPDPQTDDLPKNSNPESLPGRGRKLITFTDSRQGTARMAVRMQQEAERSRLRGLVFSILRNRQASENANIPELPEQSAEELLVQAEQLEQMGMSDLAKQRREQARLKEGALQTSKPVAIDWYAMVSELAACSDIKHSILDYNRYANPEFFGGYDNSLTLASLLLLREFARRPKNQNSSETLGLIAVGYQGLEKVGQIPRFWAETLAPNADNPSERTPLTLQDWKDFLKVTLDFYIRENTFLVMNDNERNWMGARFSPKELVPPKDDFQDSSRVKSWPLFKRGTQGNRLVKLLTYAIELDPSSAYAADKINTWLKVAWEQLTAIQLLQNTGGRGYTVTRQAINFSLPRKAWVCPMTHRMFDTTFRSVTPYIPRSKVERNSLLCKPVQLPDYTQLAPLGVSKVLDTIRQKVAENQEIKALRADSLWSDISDRTVEGGFYYRTAEHSAQQSAQRLQQYESMFKEGKVNVLNCSTTMEMGVDIGGISAVVMNNVPPHPANYLQRAGRAGRRSEARAVAYTLCKSDPHNTRVFNNPKWAFSTAIPAPVITLEAQPLVQRHVNSYLLSAFLKTETSGTNDNTRLTTLWFFHVNEGAVSRFIDWLGSDVKHHETAVRSIIRRTALELISFEQLIGDCRERIQCLAQSWQEEYKQMNLRVNQAKDPHYKKALELEKTRHENDYLLKELATKAFLPGYGFPTNVVALNTLNIEDFKSKKAQKEADQSEREDNIFTYKEQPSRGLDIAIREYAPGAQIVIDGRVYRSAGVKLQSYHEGAGGSAQKFDLTWQCHHCGAPGYQEHAYSHSENLRCKNCNSEIHISNVKRLLRPMGFTTDFYEGSSNDVSAQKFIPVERPLVYVEGATVALPDSACGFIRFGENGQIMMRSGGEHGHGFAVCMSCGRADSMTPNQEVPKDLQPDHMHRAIGGATKGGVQKECSGERVMRDIYLGYRSRTHVVELVLRNPVTRGWIAENETGRIIAITLSVALRDAAADILGIAASEIGFGVRPDRDMDSGESRYVVQIYDHVAGGAGFVLTAIDDLSALLKKMINKLECVAECETVCSSCLASKDSRVEFEQLNRKVALEWLREGQFVMHLDLPEPFNRYAGAKYWPYEPLRFVRHWINRSAESLCFQLKGDPEQWNLNAPEFRRQLLAWKVLDSCDLTLVLDENSSLTDEVKEDLALLASSGIHLAQHRKRKDDGLLAAPLQIKDKNGSVISLLTDSSTAAKPGEHWLQADTGHTWISSESLPEWQFETLDTSNWRRTSYSSARVLEVTDELNGPINTLGQRFKKLLEDKAPEFSANLSCEKVTAIKYEDRYLRTPWAIMLLAGFMQIIPKKGVKLVCVHAVREANPQTGKFIWHNFSDYLHQEEVLRHWLSAVLDIKPNIELHSELQEVSHRRVLTLTLESGKELKLAFDQGMGYWNSSDLHYELRLHNFEASGAEQAQRMMDAWKKASLVNTGDWPTDIAVYEA